MTNELIVKRIKEICKERKLTPYRLAINANIYHSTLNFLLNGLNSDIKISTLEKICNGLNIDLSDFFNHDYFKSEV